MGDLYTRKAWNDIIDRVNELCKNPPEDSDCDPIGELEWVDENHIWTKYDIDQVRNKLTEICKDNKFDEKLRLWSQKVLDEIEEAIATGWCDCNPDLCYADLEVTILYSGVSRETSEVVLHACNEASQCPPSKPGHVDYYSAGASATGFGIGIGGSIGIQRVEIDLTGKSRGNTNVTVYANGFNCDGSQKTPIPEPKYDAEGNLRDSDMAFDIIQCLACTVFDPSQWLFWCMCTPCWIGLPACCSSNPQPPSIYPCYDPGPCTCNLDEGHVRGHYGNPQDQDTSRVMFVMTKNPRGAWPIGLPCRKCCADGIGYCGKDCPDDDPVCKK